MTTVHADRTDRPGYPLPRPDESHWPGLATPPRAPFRARIAEAVFRRAVAPLALRVVTPDGRVMGSGGKSAPVMRLVRPAAFYARLGADAKIGFGESYLTGDCSAAPDTDLADVLSAFAARLTRLVPPALQRLWGLVERTQPPCEDCTMLNSRSMVS